MVGSLLSLAGIAALADTAAHTVNSQQVKFLNRDAVEAHTDTPRGRRGACKVGSVTCYSDPATPVKPGQGGILIGNPFTKQNKLPAPVTLEACAIVCWEHNLTVAGVEDADECYCGTAVMPNATKLPAGCKQRCTGGHEDCGGFFQIGVFAVECSGRKPSPPDPPPPQLFNNASLPLATRLDDLMSRFTKAELIAQLGGPGIGDIDRPGLRLQGASYGRECLSGVDGISVPENSTGTSAFPNPVNLGMSFDTALVEEVASAIGDEARALWNAGQTGAGGLSRGSGGLLCLSPVLNVARDPRWGRSYESYGEDPLAISRLGAAYIQGLQYGPGAAEVTMADNPRGYKKIGSVAKHLSAYNFEGCIGHQRYPYCTQYREFFDAVVSETDLQETYWQAWRHLAKSLSGAMCSYNAVNGVPACADRRVMTTLMRQTWNFSGSIVSDDGAVQQISNGTSAGSLHGHGYTHSVAGAAAAALEGGCDVDYGSGYSAGAQAAVAQGLINEQAIVSAVRRSLSTRMQMGEFDEQQESSKTWEGNPWNSTRLNLGVIDSAAHRALAWRAAAASIVLLENAEGARGLPIQNGGVSSKVIAVMGAGANDTHAIVNRYTGTQTNIVSLLDGVRKRAAADGVEVRYSENDTSVAIGASVIIVVVRSNEEGESHDRQNLTMRPSDADMLVRLHARQHHWNSSTDNTSVSAAAQVIVVVISGGPVDTSEPAEVMTSGFITSVVAAWQPGEEGGNAVAALLWGDIDFSASLAVTVYRQRFTSSVDIANISLVGRGYRFLRDESLALYKYGHGLSYNSWSAPSLSWDHAVHRHTERAGCDDNNNNRSVIVQIQNTGSRVGSRSILLFVERLHSSRIDSDMPVVWPNKWLVAFSKAHNVLPGQFWRGSLTFGDDELSRWTMPRLDAQAEKDSGEFRVIAGDYLLTVVDQRGHAAANLTLSLP